MHRLTILIASAAIGVGALGACGSSSGTSDATMKIEVGDSYFKPTDIQVAVGKATRMVLESQGSLTHNLSIAEMGINKDVEAGKATTVTLTPKQSGTFQFLCSYHMAQGMKGSVTVG